MSITLTHVKIGEYLYTKWLKIDVIGYETLTFMKLSRNSLSQTPSLKQGLDSDYILFPTCFTPPDQFSIWFAYLSKASRTATDVAVLAGRVAEDQRVGWHVACHHRASADEC